MNNNSKSIDELIQIVLDQLSSNQYHESTLKNYRMVYRFLKSFLNDLGIQGYSSTVGKCFLGSLNVQEGRMAAYRCAIRRLDDALENKEYKYHKTNHHPTVCNIYKDICNDYKKYCTSIGNKQNTITEKLNTVTLFLNFLSKNGYTDISTIDETIILRALLIYENKDLYAIVRSFLKFLFDQDLISRDYSVIIPRVKRSVSVPSVYTIDEIICIENTNDVSTIAGLRNTCIIMLATRLGLRAGDIAKLKRSEICISAKRINIVQEKTGEPLELEIPDVLLTNLVSYMDLETNVNYQDDYVFHALKAPYNKITTSIVGHVINEAIEAAGIDVNGRKHGPHAFRSSLATSMVNDDVPYDTVRRILGHTNPNVIVHYAKADIEKLRLCSIEPPKPSGNFSDYLSSKKVIANV